MYTILMTLCILIIQQILLGIAIPLTDEESVETSLLHDEGTPVDGNEKQWPNPEGCAILTCNRRAPHCCKGYHCSIQSFLLGGLGLCIMDQPTLPPSRKAKAVTEAPLRSSAPLPLEYTELANMVNATMSSFEEEKQYDISTERFCIPNGRHCELMMTHRLCCSGNPCQIYPSAILQVLTLGGWGICH